MKGTMSRLPALDVMRGLAVAGMILVVSPGDWGATYAPLRHADWNGWTVADMVFPAFLFSVGVALALSFPRPWRKREDRRSFWMKVARRAVLLIVIGLSLEATFNWMVAYTGGPVGRPGLANLRLPGILQRIALCYTLAAVVIAMTGVRIGQNMLMVRRGSILAAIAIILVLYWALLSFVPVPGFGAGRLDPEGNLGAFIDRSIFGAAHLWPLGWVRWGGPVVYDPEGLLSTLPATTNVLFGVLAGDTLNGRARRPALTVGLAGVVLIAAGLSLDPVIVINKRLWTDSFALLSSGVAALALAGFIELLRLKGCATLFTPLRVLGGNAILAFIVSTLLGRVYDLPIVPARIGMVAPRAWLNGGMAGMMHDPRLASTTCAVLFLASITLALWPLHRRALHVRL